jgi:hypothetical protein
MAILVSTILHYANGLLPLHSGLLGQEKADLPNGIERRYNKTKSNNVITP